MLRSMQDDCSVRTADSREIIQKGTRKNRAVSFDDRLVEHSRLFPMFADWHRNLKRSEKKALFHYCYQDDKKINGYLNGSKLDVEGEEKNKLIGMIEEISNALKRSKTPMPLKVYKGINISRIQPLIDQKANKIAKTLFMEKAFLSTSTLKGIALKHAKGAMLEIDVPKGANGAYVGALSEYLETEILFDKNQKLQITGLRKEGEAESPLLILECKLLVENSNKQIH
jgi:hypothetical protein